MAGIGIELRKLLRTQTYTGLMRAYLDASLISSGPWVLSMLVVAFIGFFVAAGAHASADVQAFTVSVTHLVATSLILTGLVQLLYTRFVADRLFERKPQLVLSNLFGVLTVTNLVGGVLASLIVIALFGDTPHLYRLEMIVGFVLLSDVWCLTVFLTGLKQYRMVLRCFALAYGLIVLLSMLLHPHGVNGLLGAFVVGQAVLVFSLLLVVLKHYPSDTLVSWEWTQRKLTHRPLMLIGLLFNIAIFVDKFLFWYNPSTSIAVIGPLRSAPTYDFPLFLAYLSMVPGLAVFLVRMETDFAERYDVYYDAVRGGDTLQHIERLRDSLIETARHGIYEILKVQITTIVLLLLFAPALLRWLHIPAPYLPLFNIDLVAVGTQVLLVAVLNTLFYLDKLGTALALCALFAAGNALLTVATQRLGVAFYGYGYAASLALATLVGLALLARKMDRLSYETFMFQPGPGGAGARARRRRRQSVRDVEAPAES
ncbi:exopolysaccharide Pel transporter PelG [Solimonas marina]|uniref:exopolysaccharide Pel transporter PelG n=1 Tax=Solimonas marina TaxID=2714601 RepID=UPI0019D27D3B|nr:exopolysaccharide Pel transporter PelG [Solimonas marina]